MVLVPSAATAGAPPAAVGLPSPKAPAEPTPCSGAPGAAENLPLYARAEPGGPGAAPPPKVAPGAAEVEMGGGADAAPNAVGGPSAGPPAGPCARAAG